MRIISTALTILAAVGTVVVLAGSDQVTCVPVEPEEPICVVPDDCADLPHLACEGGWTCQEGACAWECPPECEPGIETCGDGIDNDCDGAVDEGCCLADQDCPDGQMCEFTGPCPMCDCPPGVECPQCDCWGLCVDVKPPLPGCCTSNDQCPNGTTCVFDTCEQLPGPGECWFDEDCAPGQDCLGAITCPCGAMCFAAPQPGKCQGGVEPGGCYTDDDCAFNQQCNITNDCCSPPECTDPNKWCPDVCVPCGECGPIESECAEDADCEKGFVCEFVGYCPPCVDEDPPCMAPCWAVGQCVEMKELECSIDDDCPEGTVCTGVEDCPDCVYENPGCDMPCLLKYICLPTL